MRLFPSRTYPGSELALSCMTNTRSGGIVLGASSPSLTKETFVPFFQPGLMLITKVFETSTSSPDGSNRFRVMLNFFEHPLYSSAKDYSPRKIN